MSRVKRSPLDFGIRHGIGFGVEEGQDYSSFDAFNDWHQQIMDFNTKKKSGYERTFKELQAFERS